MTLQSYQYAARAGKKFDSSLAYMKLTGKVNRKSLVSVT